MIFTSPASYLIIGETDIDELSKQLSVSQQDLLVLDEDLSIENVRKAIKWLNIKPYNSVNKLFIISRLENMSVVVANAILKTLEEPPSYATIVLIGQSEKNILPTINSRCIKYRNYNNEVSTENEIKVSNLRNLSLKERFVLVNELVVEKNKSNIETILIDWQKELREDLLAGKNVIYELKQIARAKELTSTNISLKLLLENLVMDF